MAKILKTPDQELQGETNRLSPSSPTTETLDSQVLQGLRPWAWVILLGGLGLVFCLSVSLGSVRIPLGDVIAVLTGGEAQKDTWREIIFTFRLPKALTALLAGAALGTSGLLMQTLFRNPLADPYVLGVSSGASLGVALVVLTAGSSGVAALSFLGGLARAGILGSVSVIVASSLGSALVMGLILVVAQRVQGTVTLLILGIMFGYATSAIVSLLLYFSVAERVQAFTAWSFGSFGGVTWSQMQVLAPAVISGLTLALLLTKSLNALLLGEQYARSMGLNVQLTRSLIILATAVLAGGVTAFCGPIGFVGIAVPHVCRSLFKTNDHRILLPAVVLLGAIITTVADIAAQLPGSGQSVLPINVVTALIGAPIVAAVILRQRVKLSV